MANPYGSLGLATGFSRRLDQNRERQIADDERARQHRRQDTADANEADDRKYQVGLRDLTRQTAETNLQTARNQQQQVAQHLENEGMADLLDGLAANVDPKLAIQTYNSRGTHKIDPNNFSYDPKTRTIQTVGPDGTPQAVNLDQARSELKRVMTDSNAPPPKRDLQAVDADKVVLDETGKVIFTGSQYGKPKPEKDAAPLNMGDGTVYDPNSKKFITNPNAKPKPGKVPTAGGVERSPFNLQTSQKEARDVLGKRLGMKFDEFGAPVSGKDDQSVSETWSNLSAEADAFTSKYEDTVGAGQVANVVADSFKDMEPLQVRIKDALKKAEPQTRLVNGMPVKESKAEVRARVTQEVQQDMYQDRLTRRQQADQALAQMSHQTLQNRGMDEQAADPAAADAAAAAPAQSGRGPRSGVPLTPHDITGSDVKAVKQFQSNPALFQRLTMKDPQTGEQLGVQMPDGTVYYLVGKELRSWKPQTR